MLRFDEKLTVMSIFFFDWTKSMYIYHIYQRVYGSKETTNDKKKKSQMLWMHRLQFCTGDA
jgi:hypothetical protein